jgi:hypothetical protein
MDLLDITADLCEIEPAEVTIPTLPYHDDMSEQEKFSILYRRLQQKSRLKDHRKALFLAYHLGKFLEDDIISRTQKTSYRSQMTRHFYDAAIKSYYLFNKYGIPQIFRTKRLTLTTIRKIKDSNYKFLLNDFSLELQNFEGENC